MKHPPFRVDHATGFDLLHTDGTFDFDGGSLLVWQDKRRSHLLAAYAPGGWLCARWATEEETEEVPANEVGG